MVPMLKPAGRAWRRLPLAVFAAGLLMQAPLQAKPEGAAAYSADSELLLEGTAHEALFGVTGSGKSLFAVGAAGRVLHSQDGGKTWVREPTPGPAALLGVSAAGEHIVAVGQMGIILRRQSDASWTPVESGTKERLFNVSVNSRGVGVAVGAFGALLRTADGGVSWQPIERDWKGVFRDGDMRLGDFFMPSLYGVQVNEDNRVWVVGELALAMRSPDGGETWQITHAGGNDSEGVEPTLSAVHVRSDGTGFAVGQEGYVLKTRTSGQTWQALKRPTAVNLLGVTSSHDGVVVITGMRDMQISRDDGRNFYPVYGNGISTGWFHGVTPGGNGAHAVTVGVGGKVLQIIN
ncbi:hypothetical protein ATO7_09587 [Oceanococcus atlanticus]|uniref:Photosynthesis system II assembly factor Ycf48/Hcf136-like domain-containing protein n=1 Tax=Oceanococcus atlanticus TaxID=1317117 RepID=A0A1Y1SF17_9GAMM|nr:hypothetical protein ATO7_09587 [Oceanococcus atlanticus]